MNAEARPGPTAGKATLVIVDDHELARIGLRDVLEDQRGLEVVGEAASGREAVVLCRRLQPALVLMDVQMPDMDGLAATRALKEHCPGTSVLIVSLHENPDYLFEAIRAGAAGYVLKGATRREILAAVRQVLQGESPLPPALASQLLRRLASQPQGEPRPSIAGLTPREREVLRLLAQGQTNSEIARALSVSPSTVKSHVEHLLAKLGVSDRTQAAVRAVELGLLTSP
ncbi:MAG: response regulator transcription factor [Chloroflexi bacterium]|nr:response regulator transcription factor [Chloroflexota bacterium]